VLPVRYEHNLYIRSKAIPINRPWRRVLPVRYEHHLYMESKANPVTGPGGPQVLFL
jgi:hypothetical protein